MRSGQYTAIKFTPHDEAGVLRTVEWTPPRGISLRPAGAYLTISDAPGDFRRPDASSAEATLSPACRASRDGSLSMQGRIYYRVGGDASTSRVCTLTPGATYYVNVIFDAPIDGFNAMAALCTSEKRVCSYGIAFK